MLIISGILSRGLGPTTRAKLAERQPFENGGAKTLYVSVHVCTREHVCARAWLFVCCLYI